MNPLIFQLYINVLMGFIVKQLNRMLKKRLK
jgi:hypothetical protein